MQRLSDMSSIDSFNLPDSMGEVLLHKILSVLSGQDLTESQIERLREHRMETIEAYNEVGLANPELHGKDAMREVIDIGLKEAELRDNFKPDMLIVTKSQYLELFDIPAGVGLRPEDISSTQSAVQNHEPPKLLEVDGRQIQVTYSDSARGMLLVESGSV